MKRNVLMLVFAILFLSGNINVNGQVGVNSDGSTPDPSSIFDAKAINKGALMPRMNTAQRDAIASPARGLIVYNLDCDDFQYFNGTAWIPLGNSGLVSAPSVISGPTTPCINSVGVTYSITPISGAMGYNWTVPVGSTITGGQGTTTITVTFGSTSGAIFVSAYGTCWKSLGAYLGIQLQTLPSTPVAGVHVPSQTQIVWNWNAVQGATGYKFNTVNDYGTATDMGTATTKTETGLTCNTAYTRYVWAYNTCLGLPATLTQTTLACMNVPCPNVPTVVYEGKTYNTVQIGTQCWFKENLNIGTKINASQEQTNNQIIEKFCYNDLESNCDIYGGLYQWNEMMKYVTTPGSQGICPQGWHIPTDVEWAALSTYLGGNTVTGGKLKETGYTHWSSPNTGANNVSGFKAFGGGFRTGGLETKELLISAYFTSSSLATGSNIKFVYLGYNLNDFSLMSTPLLTNNGLSVRCLNNAGGSAYTPTVSTTSVSNITQTSANSGGIVVSDGGASVTSRGVCWSTSQNPTISGSYTSNGTGTGTFTSTISGLTANTTYYIRAYATNSVGTAYGNQVSCTTLSSVFTCGTSSITVSHVTGTVAPVNKTTTYGTVTNIPGEPVKCWITSNLGSDHQASSVNDATEASAGWYWQFNKKQGYKHDGSSRTPNTTWITSISENSDWLTANDPCGIELGSNWRIPTSTEWSNVNASGGWTNWNGPWYSYLKLHAVGYLDRTLGYLSGRGQNGFYYSSTQANSDYGWHLIFNSSLSNMSDYGNVKAYGFPLRCIKE